MPRSKFRLFAASAILSLPVLALVAAPTGAAPRKAPAAAAAAHQGEWGAFGIQTQYVDPAAKPGDDFDRHVNGRWIDAYELPADKSRMISFTKLNDLSEQRIRGILDGLKARKYPVGSSQARISAAYSAFTDTAGIEARGLAPAKPYLVRIAAAKTRDDLLALFAAPGFASPVGIGIDPDEKASDHYALHFGQAGLGLPDRDYYLVDNPRNLEIRAKYLDYLTFLLGKAGPLDKMGWADPRSAAQTVLRLETDLARATWDRTVLRNPDLTYNKLSLAELAQADPGGAARKFIDLTGAGAANYVLVQQMPPTAEELAAAKLTPEQAAKLGGGVPATLKLIDQAPLASWQAWLTARFLSDNAAVLPAEIDDANFAFYGKMLFGQPQQRPRWKRGITAVEEQIGELLGQVYAQRYYPAASRAAMAQLVGNLRRAMAANLAELKWMGPETRREAEAKLAAFTPKIGAPERFKRYEGLALSVSDPLANRMAANKWGLDFQLARLGKPVDRSEWGILPQTVNAYYNATFNEVVFPAAILQPPFFNPSADPAVNYGAIGAVIGHELGHGFDDEGSKFDGAGNLRNWWTPADRAAFEALTGKLVAQYSAFCPFDEGKTCVNGQLTLGENIGDLGGLSLAYRAYHMSLNGKEAPVINGVTGDQRFFMAWAQIWRAKSREARARQMLLVDPHSPDNYRINGIVRNFDEWYRAFDVKPGDKLYLPPEQRVRIW